MSTNGTPDTDSARVSDEERTTAIKAVEVSQ